MEDPGTSGDRKVGVETGGGRKKRRFISKAFVDSSDEENSGEEREPVVEGEGESGRDGRGERGEGGGTEEGTATSSESSSSDRLGICYE